MRWFTLGSIFWYIKEVPEYAMEGVRDAGITDVIFVTCWQWQGEDDGFMLGI